MVPPEANSEKQTDCCERTRFRGAGWWNAGPEIWTNRFATDEGHLRQSLQSGITIRKFPCEG